MPIYEYRCDSCDRVVEVIQKFADDPLTLCESCGGPLERLLSPPGLHFKGSGWYVTDYARAGQRSNEGKDSKGSTESKDGKSKKTETKKSDTTSSSSKTPTSTTT